MNILGYIARSFQFTTMKIFKNSLFVMLIIAFAVVSCKKDDDSSDDNTTPAPTNKITSEYYFYAKIDGKEVLLQHGVNGFTNGSAMTGSSYGTDMRFQTDHTLIATFPSQEQGSFGILDIIDVQSQPTVEHRKQMFKVGSYDYGAYYSSDKEIKGAVVEYTDKNGVFWSSDLYFGTQGSGSSFKLIEATEKVDPTGTNMIIAAEFTCTLYDGNGNSKQLTGGKARGRAVPDY